MGEIPEEITAKPLPKLMICIKLKIQDAQLIQQTNIQTSENQRQRGKFEGNHKTKTYFLQENNKKEDYSGFIVK